MNGLTSPFQRSLLIFLAGLAGVWLLASDPWCWILAAALTGGYALVLALGVALPGMGFFLPVIVRGQGPLPDLSLTFDDGPDPDVTPLVLDVLARRGVRATFFVIGQKAVAHPSIIHRMVREGHLIGNHSFSHGRLHNFLWGKRLLREIMAAQEAIFSIIRRSPTLYRPPVGLTNPHLAGALKQAGLMPVAFDVRPRDRGKAPGKVLAKVVSKAKPGSIVVLHDGGANRHTFPDMVDRLIDMLGEKGLPLTRLDRLLGLPPWQEDQLEAPDEDRPAVWPAPLRRLAGRLSNRLVRIEYVRLALADRADLSVFRGRPSARLIIGVLVICLAQLMGLPAVAGFGVAAAWMQKPVMLVGAPISYVVSWGVWCVGMWLAGPDNIMYLKALGRWSTRRGLETLIRIRGEEESEFEKTSPASRPVE